MTQSLSPRPPRLPTFSAPEGRPSGDLTALDLDGRSDGLLFDSDDADGQDLEDTVFTDCTLRRVSFQGAALNRATFGTCEITDLSAASLRAPDSGWWNTRLQRTRIGSAELHGANVRAVLFEGGKLDLVNLRGAKLRDVVFRSLIIDELDLGDVQAERIAFEDCRIGMLVLHGARLKDVDLRGAAIAGLSGVAGLRGATVSELQLQDLAPLLATESGLRVL
ncbi:pentapeptide repeat-containing protein [Arthrobacter rhombi]|uniref:pentapeptide repeat-containing protein n=1 Tax=Arthrobacter rhombi TaxID=71253 RepID=UPI0031D90904